MATEVCTSTYLNDRHDVKALVNYLPLDKMDFGPDDMPAPKKFGDFIESSRGKEDSFKLDRNGFEIVTLPERERDVSTDDKITEDFMPEIIDIIKKRTGASTVVPFAHVLRRTENKFFAEIVDKERYNRFSTVWPHSDFPVVYPERLPYIKEGILNYDGIPEDTREELKKAAESASRWAFLQIWKPLKTLKREPLALCDSSTLSQEDWRFRQAEDPRIMYSLLAHTEKEEKHKWYYVHEMNPNEMFLFKGCDSRQGEPGFTGYAGAHTAFALPDSQDQPPRESIEARFFCLWE
ncbi:hypothetical protein KVR01_002708 [Diaporthe batatas]|uniref:uncharacterized protein n=1 Tax=Diaporthe batatas TaxID=748121 RepID=UPI001D04DA04|nr:uncharacterized protein KVR01_002708 [Diaporthe batatas]KAG8167019.1 hypothetical protein KVR01_002708 [Diaporthe batatas]